MAPFAFDCESEGYLTLLLLLLLILLLLYQLQLKKVCKIMKLLKCFYLKDLVFESSDRLRLTDKFRLSFFRQMLELILIRFGWLLLRMLDPKD